LRERAARVPESHRVEAGLSGDSLDADAVDGGVCLRSAPNDPRPRHEWGVKADFIVRKENDYRRPRLKRVRSGGWRPFPSAHAFVKVPEYAESGEGSANSASSWRCGLCWGHVLHLRCHVLRRILARGVHGGEAGLLRSGHRLRREHRAFCASGFRRGEIVAGCGLPLRRRRAELFSA